jgi:hypothetical protein
MSHVSPDFVRSCIYLGLALALFANGAEAGVGDSSGSALSLFGRLSPAQKAQYGGANCYYGLTNSAAAAVESKKLRSSSCSEHPHRREAQRG